jgi:hypothetical protein
VLGQQLPVKPTGFIVLAIGVIVAALTTPHLIAHYKHGHTDRQYGGGEEVLYLLIAQPLYFAVVRRTFEATVPASVVIAAIEIAFAIFFIVSGFF